MMELLIRPDGQVRCVYAEVIDLRQLGVPCIYRASHVEPDERGLWHADLSVVAGPVLGPFNSRSLALEREAEWLSLHWLART